MIVREHVWDEAGRCIHCPDHRCDNIGEQAERPCIPREIPRAVPESVFAKLGDIGERLQEIKREENRNAV